VEAVKKPRLQRNDFVGEEGREGGGGHEDGEEEWEREEETEIDGDRHRFGMKKELEAEHDSYGCCPFGEKPSPGCVEMKERFDNDTGNDNFTLVG